MPIPFPDRSETLFGRARDIDFLLERVQLSGITFLFGDSQIGKSTLLKEVARRRSLPVLPSLLVIPPCLAGYAESQGQNEDLFLIAVADLYARWISSTTFADQVEVLNHQQKRDFIGRFGEAVGATFEKLAKLGGKPAEFVGSSANLLLKTLAALNRDVTTGGLQIIPLPIDQGRDLLSMVNAVTGQPILLILDQWEKVRLPVDANLLESFVRHVEDWPACHILIASLPLESSKIAAENLRCAYPAEVAVRFLAAMELNDSGDAAPLINSVRNRVPAAGLLNDEDLLNLIAGHPEVINRWTKREPIQTVARLRQLAEDAHAHRFTELKAFPSLPKNQVTLAMRLALMPASNLPETWEVLKPIFMEDVEASDLDMLFQMGIFESSQSTIFGHTKRSEVALQMFVRSCPHRLNQVADALCISLAARIRDLSLDIVIPADCFVRIHSVSSSLTLSPLSNLLCEAALSIYGEPDTSKWDDYISTRSSSPSGWNRAAPLLAVAVLKTIFLAKDENKLLLRDAALDELRALASKNPNEPSVHSFFASGLSNVLGQAAMEGNSTRRDTLLNELRAFAKTNANELAVREELAYGLNVTHHHVGQEDNFQRRNALLDELRMLARDNPSNAKICGAFAEALLDTVEAATGADERARRDAVLQELRTLGVAHLGHSTIRGLVANSFINAFINASEQKDVPGRDFFLQELRNTAAAYSDDAFVCKRLAICLLKTFIDTEEEGMVPRRAELLNELFALNRLHPGNDTISDCCNKGVILRMVENSYETYEDDSRC